ncbi:MAG: aldehyde dehydrogenase (NADP(+)) [Planctomycetales bacterium]|nr:aldehyde dehydrogenase (NADP(+)) [Planctomycetales bacterium]
MSQKPDVPVLINGQWQCSASDVGFQAFNPATGNAMPEVYPVSNWKDCEAVLNSAADAAAQLRKIPASQIAAFLEAYAQQIESAKADLVEIANQETALPKSPRLGDVELPRTTGQLRQAAAAATTGSWALPVIDTKANIRSCYLPIGPVCVFGPNNFPFAFNSVAGGDFAAAIAAGNPVIGKANTSHPGTTRKLAELAQAAVLETGLPRGTVQLLYRVSHDEGARLVSDSRLGAIGYTGSRHAGLVLKSAADRVGKPIYLELSSVNPVVLLPGALAERGNDIITEFVTSVLMGTGQFCTNPGLIVALRSAETEAFVQAVVGKFNEVSPGTLLSSGVKKSLTAAISVLTTAGAKLLCGGNAVDGQCSVQNTLLEVNADKFIAQPETFQTEAFGNASLVVIAEDVEQMRHVVACLEGNLTGCIYSANSGSDDHAYDVIAGELTQRVGRVLNDKMPTGVAVSSAMNHGGPFPATGHPGFTAVGIPASLLRFGKLTCFDAVRGHRLPWLLQDKNPTGKTYRMVDLQWTTADV